MEHQDTSPELDPEQIIHAAIEALQHPDKDTKFAAAITLSHYMPLPDAGMQILIEALENSLGEYDARYRLAAAFAFGRQPTLTQEAVLALTAALQDSDDLVRLESAVVLSCADITLPDAGIQALIDALENRNGQYEITYRVMATLAFDYQKNLSEQENALLALIAVLQDHDERIRVNAAVTLSRHMALPEIGIQVLIKAIENKNGHYEELDRDRARAIEVLSYQIPSLKTVQRENALSTLFIALQDHDEWVRFQAATALYALDIALPHHAAQIFMDAIENKNEIYEAKDRAAATIALSTEEKLSDAARSVLSIALQDNDEWIRLSAACALSQHRIALPSTSLQLLIDTLKKSDVYAAPFRIQAATALGSQETLSDAARSVLTTALQDNDEQVRTFAALALSEHMALSDSEMQVLKKALEKLEYNEGFTKIL